MRLSIGIRYCIDLLVVMCIVLLSWLVIVHLYFKQLFPGDYRLPGLYMATYGMHIGSFILLYVLPRRARIFTKRKALLAWSRIGAFIIAWIIEVYLTIVGIDLLAKHYGISMH